MCCVSFSLHQFLFFRITKRDPEAVSENDILTMPEENDQNEGIADQQDKQTNKQSTEHLSEHIEHQNEKDLESGIATEESGTLKSHYEITKDQLDNLIKLRVNNEGQRQLEIELDDNIFHGKPFRTIYRY